jgi:CRP-like cAMP-binding protein
MQTVSDLGQAAERSMASGAFDEALRLQLQILHLQPLNLDARLRVADAMLALGEVQRAATVYTRLAQYATQAGYPLRALTALKLLSTLQPELHGLVRGVGELYGRGSTRLGASVRRSLPDMAQSVPRSSMPTDAGRVELLAHAERSASDYGHAHALMPDKLMPIPLLSSLDQADLARVFAACSLIRVRASTVIAEQGSHGRSLYVLARGAVRVQRRASDGRERELGTVREGAVFGELSFLSATPRSAAVVAVTDCDLLELSHAALERTGEAREHLQAVVATFARERLLAHVMAHSPIFAPLHFEQRLDLIARFVELDAPTGTAVMRQGEPSQGAFIVLRGEVAVWRSEGAHDVELARLGPSELFGEMSLLSGETATARVLALEPTTLLWLAKPYFERLLHAVPELRASIEKLVQARMRSIATSFPPPEPSEDSDIDIDVLV